MKREREIEIGIKFDGTVCGLATNSSIWSVRDGRELSVYHLAELMGHRMTRARYNNAPLSEPMFRTKLGLGMHVASCGSMLMVLLASLK